MKSLRPLFSILLRSLLPLSLWLGGCASTPSAPEPVPPYYNGPLTLARLDGIQQISIRANVPHPARTRYASIGSRLPFYGMLLPDMPSAKQAPAPFGEFALDPLLDVSAVTSAELRRQLAIVPSLSSRISGTGASPGTGASNNSASLQIEIIRVSIFGKDVSNVSCQPLILMDVRLVDAAGYLRWHSGLTGNRIDDRVGYLCQDIQHKPEVAVRAITEALHTAIASIVGRI